MRNLSRHRGLTLTSPRSVRVRILEHRLALGRIEQVSARYDQRTGPTHFHHGPKHSAEYYRRLKQHRDRLKTLALIPAIAFGVLAISFSISLVEGVIIGGLVMLLLAAAIVAASIAYYRHWRRKLHELEASDPLIHHVVYLPEYGTKGRDWSMWSLYDRMLSNYIQLIEQFEDVRSILRHHPHLDHQIELNDQLIMVLNQLLGIAENSSELAPQGEFVLERSRHLLEQILEAHENLTLGLIRYRRAIADILDQERRLKEIERAERANTALSEMTVHSAATDVYSGELARIVVQREAAATALQQAVAELKEDVDNPLLSRTI
ncbi:hypothetical protein [Brevibacterium daeguense]